MDEAISEASRRKHELTVRIKQALKDKRLVIVVGAGVTLNATADENGRLLSRITWQGLIRNGLDYLVTEGYVEASNHRTRRAYDALEDADTDGLLDAANILSDQLTRQGQFPTWLDSVFGSLHQEVRHPSILNVLKALHEEGATLLTTTYDDILERHCGLRRIGRSNREDVLKFKRGDIDGVFHIHGSYHDPQEVVLDTTDYYQVRHSDEVQSILKYLLEFKTILFVGCASGLEDPNFDALLTWASAQQENIPYRHYLLIRDSDTPTYRSLIRLKYGPNYGDLVRFLNQLHDASVKVPRLRQEAQPGIISSTASDNREYGVGWICAVQTEYVVACELLDEEYLTPSLASYHDNNAYTCGRMSDHNVVVACLPKGTYGLTSAAVVAKDMLRSFPSIRFGLMVGVGGGAPSKKHDIRLGDVVVSTPVGGTGGVIHYEFGKTIQNQKFERTGALNAPPPVLRTALQKLSALHERRGHQIRETVDQMITRNARLKIKYQQPDPQSDVLYQSSFIHTDPERSCMELCRPYAKQIIKRVVRDGNQDDPIIHYGLIASADRVMKDAQVRDHLAETEGVLCFEMEAAGLMDNFPCVVIRGICDYSDSHKNDAWQGYAAATAAAYAKKLLKVIVAVSVRATTPVAESDVSNDASNKLRHVIFNDQAPVQDQAYRIGREKATSLNSNSVQKDVVSPSEMSYSELATPHSIEPTLSSSFKRGRQPMEPLESDAPAVSSRRSMSDFRQPLTSTEAVLFPRAYPPRFQSGTTVSGFGHQSKLDRLLILGNHYKEQGRLHEAEEMYRQTLEGRKNKFGPEHESTLEIVILLGRFYVNQGRLPDAEKMYHQALEARLKTLGPEHSSTLEIASMMGNLLANVSSEQDSMAEAASLQKEVVDGLESALGNDHPETIAAIGNLANMLADQGKLQNAATAKMKTMKRGRGYHEDFDCMLIALWSVASLRDQGAIREASLCQHQALEQRRQLRQDRSLWGDHNRVTIAVKSDLARTLMDLGKREGTASTQRLKRVVGILVNDALEVSQEHNLLPTEEESINGLSVSTMIIQLLRSTLFTLSIYHNGNEILEDADLYSEVFTCLRTLSVALHILMHGPNGAATVQQSHLLYFLHYAIESLESLNGLEAEPCPDFRSRTSDIFENTSLTAQEKIALIRGSIMEEMALSDIMSDSMLTTEDKITLMIMLTMKKMDRDIEWEMKRQDSSSDVDRVKLKRMIDKRSQTFEMLRSIIDRYNETAKNIIASIGR